MGLQQLLDDNGREVPGVFRPDFARIKVATTGAAIAELDISAMNIAANRTPTGEVVLRLVVVSNPCYVSLGAASSAPADNTTMMLLPVNTPTLMRARSTDVSVYHQQITGAGTLQVTALI